MLYKTKTKVKLQKEGSDQNYDNDNEIVLNFELPIVANIALPT